MCHVLLQVSDLTVRYGRTIQGLMDVHVDVPDGSVTAVLGANGAGKSTLLRAISATLPLHRGKVVAGGVSLEGRDITKLDPAEIVKAGVVQVPEGRQIFTTMSVEENLRAGALIVPKEKRGPARDRVFELFPRLAERRTQRAGLLSGGEQQMLAMGRALMSSPKVLLLDEPSLGLAPKMISLIGEIIREINAAGTAVLLVEQNAAMALKVAKSVVVLEVGRLALTGSAEDVKDSPELAALYLGGHGDSHAEADSASESAGASPSGESVVPVGRRTLSKWQG
jgi:branched-chain amino acid transport system ATP-binding protein